MSRTALSLIAVFCLSLCAGAQASSRNGPQSGESLRPAGGPAGLPETAEGGRISAFLAAAAGMNFQPSAAACRRGERRRLRGAFSNQILSANS
jgi:hypothetical protein